MQRTRILPGLLGIAHVLVAIILLPSALFPGLFAAPVIIPGLVWLAVLGFRLCRPDRSLRSALRMTHKLLIPISILLVLYGSFCLYAATRSAEAGGGLMGSSGLIPIVMGILAGALSAVSLICRPFKCIDERERRRTRECRRRLTARLTPIVMA